MPSKSDTAITIFSNDMGSLSDSPHQQKSDYSSVIVIAFSQQIQQLNGLRRLQVFNNCFGYFVGLLQCVVCTDFGDLIIGAQIEHFIGELLGYP